MMSHGMEHWHPNPGFFFRPGAGPVFDMGPYYLSALVTLLGPVASVQATGQIGFAERIVTTSGSLAEGQSIKVETLTNVHACSISPRRRAFHLPGELGRLEARHAPRSNSTARRRLLRLPDPNWFGGDL